MGVGKAFVTGTQPFRTHSRSDAIIDQLCDDFEKRLKMGDVTSLDAYLSRVEDTDRPSLLRELVLLEQSYLPHGKVPQASSDICSVFLSMLMYCAGSGRAREIRMKLPRSVHVQIVTPASSSVRRMHVKGLLRAMNQTCHGKTHGYPGS